MVAKFVAEEGSLKGLVLLLDEAEGDQWVIGRDPDTCQLLIEDPAASRRHLICRATPQGITVENLSSTNPVQINELEVTEPQLLQNGDLLKIGSGAFRFFMEKEEAHEEIFSENELKEEVNFEEETQPSTFAEKEPFKDHSEEDSLLADIDFDMIEEGRWLLKVIGGPNNGAEFTMRSGDSYIVGTDTKSCDVVFNDTSISRKHARIRVSDEDLITIEDLGSRNGTFVDGKKLEERHGLEPNIVVNVGTSAFVIFDRESEMHTIISPLLPSIVKVLQKDAPHPKEHPFKEEEPADAKPAPSQASLSEEETMKQDFKEKSHRTLTAFILIAIITGIFVTMGIGMVTLFQSNPINPTSSVDTEQKIAEAMAPFPGVKWSYNSTTGTVMLVGHVLTDNAKKQLQYNFQGLQLNNIDDNGIVIDERVWQEFNPNLAKQNPAWRGVTLQASAPGEFVLRGYLKTRAQMESLIEYLNANFPYLDRLKYNVVVEQELISKARLLLSDAGFQNVQMSVNTGGDVVLQGVISTEAHEAFEKVMTKISKIPGVRNVQDYVTETAQSHSTIDVTDRYIVSGVSQTGGKVSAIIDGKIVTKGDLVDGMTVKEINAKTVLLEKGGVTYRIDLK